MHMIRTLYAVIHCLAFLIAACQGQESCTSCAPDTAIADCTLEKGGRDFDPGMKVDQNICQNIRSTVRQVQRLCQRHPNGYNLRCTAGGNMEYACRHQYICVTTEQQSQRSRNGSSHSKSSPSLFLLLLLPVFLYKGLQALQFR